jgi:hypothetical protein
MCTGIESEGNMKNYDYNDDFASVIDQILCSKGIYDAYQNEESHDWIIKVEDEGFKEGLNHLNEKQIGIIEDMFFEGKCFQDICNKNCLSHDGFQKEFKEIKKKLVDYL